MTRIIRLADLEEDALDPLIHEARVEGFRHLDRLRDEYVSGANRFNKPGEALFGVFIDGEMVGVGGLNRDPYDGDGGAGRVRRVYIRSSCRRDGRGRLLMEAIVGAALGHFSRITLHTDSGDAAAFYQALGFVAVATIPGATHSLSLTEPTSGNR